MNMIVFSIYDSKAEMYMQPIFQPTHASAVRAFSGEVNRSGSLINAYPSDYFLFEIGFFDDETGVIVPNTSPVKVVAAEALVHSED